MKRSSYTLRRLLALVLALVMIASLFAGCSKKDPDPTNPSDEPTATVGQTDPTDAPTDPTEEPTEEPTEPTVTVPPVTMGTVNYDNLNVRVEPYSTADILKRLPINTRIEIEEQKIVDGVNWGRIAEGWVNLNYVTIDGEGTGTGTGTGTVIDNDNNIGSGTVNTDVNKTYNGVITATELYIREDADEDSKSLGTYKKGDKVVIIGQRDGWGKTNKGWISMKYVDIGGTTSGSTGSSSTGSSTSGSNTGTVSNGNKVVLGTGTVINTTSLAVRSGPGTNYAQVSFVRLGETHEYFQWSGNWIRLKKGWVNSKYMELEYNIASGTVGTVNTGELNIREKADADSKSLATVKKGDSVTILEVDGTWGKVEYETGKFGWVNLDYIKISTASSTYAAGEYVVTADALHYRKEANADSTALGTYKKDDKVTVTEVAGNWGKTDKGWINLNYTTASTIYSTGTGEVTASSLNVRSKPSTSGDDIGSLKKGDKVTILDVEGNWGKIDYKGKTGWISLKYVDMDPAAKYTVTVDSKISGGKVSVSSTSYTKGSIVSVTVSPDEGKALDTLTVKDASGNSVTVKDNKFTMPASNVTITATFSADAVKYTVSVQAPTGGTISVDKTSAKENATVTLSATPASGYVLKNFTAVKSGSLESITVSANGSFTMPAANVTVSAVFEKTTATTYNVKVGTLSNGTVKPSTTSAVAGATVSLTVTPNDGYELVANSLSVVDAGNNSITVTGNSFTMPASNVTISASFKEVSYTVDITTPVGGTVTATPSPCAPGDTVTLTITPETGYELETIKVNTSDLTSKVSNGTLQFAMPKSAATVVATFKKIQYTVSIDTAVTAQVKADKTSAGVGDTVKLTITPADGKEVDTVTVTYNETSNSATANSDGTYSFAMPASNVKVTATFKDKAPATYTVTVNSAANGTVIADKASAVAGAKVKLTITPTDGYKLKSLTVDGSAATVTGGVYEFEMPAKNIEVSATFEYVPVQYKTSIQVNIRKEASSSSADIGDIPADTIIESLEGSTSSWIKVNYNNIEGWVGTGNLTKVTSGS